MTISQKILPLLLLGALALVMLIMPNRFTFLR